VSYFIPVGGTWNTTIKDRTNPRYWKVLIDTDGDDSVDDVTSQIYNNEISGGQRKGSTAAQWTVTLRNSQQTYQEGDLAGRKAEIQAKVASESYITVFTGYVSDAGCQRSKTSLTEDKVTLTLFDLVKTKATRRKTDAAIYSGFDISDTASTSTSLIHTLAGMMGLSASDMDITDINHAVTLVSLDAKATAWKELQRIAEQYLADMYVRYDGKLRFRSRFETGWSAPSSEWDFYTSGENANVHSPWSGSMRPKSCTRCETSYDDYEDVGSQQVYKNTDEWVSATEQNAIVVGAGEYWPGPGSGDVARLKYKDPKSGEEFPFVRDVSTPSIGATGSGSNIECSGGLLTLVSFNGSTSATQQNADSSEIILQNATGSPVTITKFELWADHPYRVSANNTVKHIDSAVSNEEDHVDKSLDGKYASDDDQAHESCEYTVEFGKDDREEYELTVDWLPQVQKRALVTFNIVEESRSVTCYVESFTHVASGPMARWKTRLSLIKYESYTYSGSNRIVRALSIGDIRPTIDGINSGITDAQDSADSAQTDATQALADAATAITDAATAQTAAELAQYLVTVFFDAMTIHPSSTSSRFGRGKRLDRDYSMPGSKGLPPMELRLSIRLGLMRTQLSTMYQRVMCRWAHLGPSTLAISRDTARIYQTRATRRTRPGCIRMPGTSVRF